MIPLKIDSGNDFDQFGEGRWGQVGPKMGSIIDLVLKSLKDRKLI